MDHRSTTTLRKDGEKEVYLSRADINDHSQVIGLCTADYQNLPVALGVWDLASGCSTLTS